VQQGALDFRSELGIVVSRGMREGRIELIAGPVELLEERGVVRGEAGLRVHPSGNGEPVVRVEMVVAGKSGPGDVQDRAGGENGSPGQVPDELGVVLVRRGFQRRELVAVAPDTRG